jgi:tRNA-Thr(GGU) m(6)t(6)A37 methyltransferase TsaA
MDPITYMPIGVIHTPFVSMDGMPVQSVASGGVAGTVELDPHFQEGLSDLAAFSHLILVTHLHQVTGYSLTVVPFLDDRPHGIFATRSPRRPNPIGISIVRLTAISGSTLHIEDIDVVDGTPLLDLKPFVPAIDNRQTDRTGWFAERLDRLATVRSDYRFTRDNTGGGCGDPAGGEGQPE